MAPLSEEQTEAPRSEATAGKWQDQLLSLGAWPPAVLLLHGSSKGWHLPPGKKG